MQSERNRNQDVLSHVPWKDLTRTQPNAAPSTSTDGSGRPGCAPGASANAGSASTTGTPRIINDPAVGTNQTSGPTTAGAGGTTGSASC